MYTGPTRIPCGVGPPTLVCSETPGIQAVDLHNGYWDVPCTGEPPDGCPSPIVPPTGAAARGARALRLATLDVPVGEVGHHEVEIGTGGFIERSYMPCTEVNDDIDPIGDLCWKNSKGCSRAVS